MNGSKIRNEIIQECGWDNLIRNMVEEIENICPDTEFQIYCKEKFGELLVISFPNNEHIEEIVYKYEIMSQHICENCEDAGERKDVSGWVKTLCSNCYKKALKIHNQ